MPNIPYTDTPRMEGLAQYAYTDIYSKYTYPVLINDIGDHHQLAIVLAVVDKRNPPNLDVTVNQQQKQGIACMSRSSNEV